MSVLRVFVVEDEAPARRKLLRLLAANEGIEAVGEAGDGNTALARIPLARPHLVLLDIAIPAPDGLQVAASLVALPPPHPQIVFLTAHDQHAVRAFALRACDYLLKPYQAERLADMLARVRARLPPPAWPKRLVVDTGRGEVAVAAADITRIVAAGNYVEIQVAGRSLLTRATLAAIETQVDPAAFVRISRSALVRTDAIAELRRRPHGEFLVKLNDGAELVWTRRFRRVAGPLVPASGRLVPKA